MNKLFYILTAAILFFGCYDKEKLEPSIIENDFAVEDSSDPIDHYRYEIYSKYNTKIMFEYDTIFYRWSTKFYQKGLKYTEQKDRKALEEGVNFLKDNFISKYSEEMKKILPPYILLSESIEFTNSYSGKTSHWITSYGISHICLGEVRLGLKDLKTEDPETFRELVVSLHTRFFRRYLLQNEIITIPDEFYSYSKIYYGEWYLGAPNGMRPDIGFLKLNSWGDAPSESSDVLSYLTTIMDSTDEELTELLESYPMVRKKYNVLFKYFKSEYNFDLKVLLKE